MSKKTLLKSLIKTVEADGWYLVKNNGHKQFKHPTKPGKVTIPHDITKNIELSVYKQAGIERRKNGRGKEA